MDSLACLFLFYFAVTRKPRTLTSELVSDPEFLVTRDSKVRNLTYEVQGERITTFIF